MADPDFLMARTALPPGTLDLGIGEPHVLRELVTQTFGLKSFDFTTVPHIWEYAPPNGYLPLVKKLEDIYQAPVVMSVGAKHGLFAAMQAVYNEGARSLAYRSPYWASIPHMVEKVGLKSTTDYSTADAHLLVMPNNPDGFVCTEQDFKASRGEPKPLIHDAAYFTESYVVPEDTQPMGDLQVFSVSKMYGLSGLRLGFVVCRDPKYYSHLTSYVEATTAGISTASMRILLQIVEAEAADPLLRKAFSEAMQAHLKWAHTKLSELDPEVLRPVGGPGMFGWCIKGPKFDPDASRVNVMDGAPFGDPSMVRLNLAVSQDILSEAVLRLNSPGM
jgi:aspartate/methionine/tyrosine aminotransferase